MMSLMPWDELNVFRESVTSIQMSGKRLQDRKKFIIDSLLELLIIAYCDGVYQVNEDLSVDKKPNEDKMYDAIYRKVEDMDFTDRINNYCETDDIDGIFKVAETEMHYDYNTGAYDTATDVDGKTIRKRWRTMEDDRVRDTHDYMNGQEVGLDDYFYSSTGAATLYPGGFGMPEEDCGCRCHIEYVAY